MANDFTGNKLFVGDEVVFIQLRYRNLLTGTIASITDKMCLIKHEKTNAGNTETRQFHNQIIKIK